MYGTDICLSLNDLLHNGEICGRVHSIFSSSMNVILENGRIITILNSSKPMVPFSIKTDCESFTSLNISIGEKVFISDKRLSFTNFYIAIDKPRLINMSYEISNDKKPDYLLFQAKQKSLKYYLLLNGKTDGILSILKDIEVYVECGGSIDRPTNNFDIVLPRILRLMDCFRDKRLDELTSLTAGCTGFGVGLTPSSDDFLCGMMASMMYGNVLSPYGDRYFADIIKMMTLDIRNRTTAVSENFLINSGDGIFPVTIKSLVRELYSGESFSKSEFTVLLRNVIHFGETSGTDIMCGIYIGSLVITYYFGGRSNE